MTQHQSNPSSGGPGLAAIVTAEAARPGLLRQLGNGVGGLAVLLLTGLILIIAVLIKSR